MTSNQVSYAAVQVNQQVADETARHNQALEQETATHNRELEGLERWSLELRQTEINNTNDWNTTKNRLTEEYNSIMRDYYNASLDEKTWYDSQIAYIKQQEQFADEQYKIKMAALQSEQNALTGSKLTEENRHNKELEKLQNRNMDIQEYANTIRERQLDYQNRQWETENWLAFEKYGLQYQELGLKQTQEQHTYELGLMNAELQGASNLIKSRSLDIQEQQYQLAQQQFELSQEQWQQNKKESQSRVFSNYVSPFMRSSNEAAANVLRGLQLIVPLL